MVKIEYIVAVLVMIFIVVVFVKNNKSTKKIKEKELKAQLDEISKKTKPAEQQETKNEEKVAVEANVLVVEQDNIHKFFNAEKNMTNRQIIDGIVFKEVENTVTKKHSEQVKEDENYFDEIGEIKDYSETFNPIDDEYNTASAITHMLDEDDEDIFGTYDEDFDEEIEELLSEKETIAYEEDEISYNNQISEEFANLSPEMKALIIADIFKNTNNK